MSLQMDVTINDREYIAVYHGEFEHEVDVQIGDLALHFPNQETARALRDKLSEHLERAAA